MRKKKPSVLLLAFACLSCGGAIAGPAQGPGQPASPYVRQAWTTEQGLPQNSVMAVVQTPDGTSGSAPKGASPGSTGSTSRPSTKAGDMESSATSSALFTSAGTGPCGSAPREAG